MRVLHVVPVGPAGGAPSFIQAQVDLLAAAGVDCKMIKFSGCWMASHPHRLPRAFLRIRREIRLCEPDIVHAHWGSLLALVCAIASIGGPPLIISYRGSDINPVPSESALRSAVRVLCSQLGAMQATAIISVSDELRCRLWTGRSLARVVVDGTDLARFSPSERRAARIRLGWPQDEPVVLFNAGRSPAVKRLDLAEASVSDARRRLGRLRFEVMDGNVQHDKVPQLLNASDCLLLTSDFEGSPNTVREAVACGIPVVTVPVGDVHRWLHGAAAARVVDRDPAAIGAAIAEVIAAGERLDVGDEIYEFSDLASRDAILEVYERLV